MQQQIAGQPKPLQWLVAEAFEIAARERAGERLKVREFALLRLVDRLVFAKVRARFGGRLKYAFSGGAALSTEVAEFIDSLGIMVYEGYGLTETSPVVTANSPGARKIGSVGRPIPGVRVEIDPDTGETRASPDGKSTRFEGEIVIYGPNVMKGYLSAPKRTPRSSRRTAASAPATWGTSTRTAFSSSRAESRSSTSSRTASTSCRPRSRRPLKLSPYVVNAMVYGDNRPYNVALVVVDVPAVRRVGGGEHARLPNGDADLLADARVRSLIKAEIEKHGGAFKGFEAIRDFALIGDDFTTDNGMLTPSLKLKRRKVVETYGSLLEQMYAKAKASPRPSAGAPPS